MGYGGIIIEQQLSTSTWTLFTFLRIINIRKWSPCIRFLLILNVICFVYFKIRIQLLCIEFFAFSNFRILILFRYICVGMRFFDGTFTFCIWIYVLRFFLYILRRRRFCMSLRNWRFLGFELRFAFSFFDIVFIFVPCPPFFFDSDFS